MSPRIANPQRNTRNRRSSLSRTASFALIAVLALPTAATAQPGPCDNVICGDTNGDGVVDGADLDGFMMAVSNPAAVQFGDVFCICDINRDCHVDDRDIEPFFGLLTSGGTCDPIQLFCCRWFFGLEHCPLGQTDWLKYDGSGNLLVTKIGSSGQDGVSIHLGDEAEGCFFETKLDPTLPLNIEMVVAGIGTVNGSPDQPTGTLSLTHIFPGLYPVAVDLSPRGAATFSVEIYTDNSLTYQEPGLTGDEIALQISSATRARWGTRRSFSSVQLDDVVSVHIRTGTHPGDLVVFRPENPTMSVDALSRIDVTLADLNPLTVYDEALLKFQHHHQALGRTRMVAGSGILTISNIDSNSVFNSVDGVSIDLVDVELVEPDRFHVSLDPVDLSAEDAAIAVSATGTLDNQPDTVLGTVGYRNNDPDMQIVTDFSVFGVPEVRVEVYDAGAFRGSFVTLDGGIVATATVPSGQAQIIQTGIDAPAHAPTGYSLKFDRIARIDRVPVGEFFYGDQVRLIPDSATLRAEKLTAFDISAKELASFVITDEIANPCGGYLCGDANCDGLFNGGDIDSFFLALVNPTQWSVQHPDCNMECVADINGDNAVRGDDIDAFFAALGTGSCP